MYIPDSEPTEAQIWSLDTIIERTKDVILTYASVTTGQISDKPKAGVLFQLKDGIYWWASRIVDGFFGIFAKWHTYSVAAIHKAALEEGFETGWREKNNLTDAELNLFWDQLSKKLMANMDNWKQHFVAWLLVWVTSSRPGSFTVAYGYEAGSSVATGIYHNMADTLRWRDLSFVRIPESEGGGIAVKGIWRHQNGFRVPHKQQQSSGNQKFNIMPLKDNTYHLDLALLLVSLAFSRGLFHYETLYELFNGTELNIQQVDEVADRAVFLTSNQSGILNPTEPMHEKAPNAKLREMGAIVDSRRKSGTESAKTLAGHAHSRDTIRVYDEDSLADEDIANIRHGSEATSQQAMRKMFSQATTKRVVVDEDNVANMRGAVLGEDQASMMTREASDRAKSDSKILDMDDTLIAALSGAKQLIISRGVDPDMMTNNFDTIDQLQSFLATGDAECQAALTEMDGIKLERRDLLRVLRRAARVAINQEWGKEAEKAQSNLER